MFIKFKNYIFERPLYTTLIVSFVLLLFSANILYSSVNEKIDERMGFAQYNITERLNKILKIGNNLATSLSIQSALIYNITYNAEKTLNSNIYQESDIDRIFISKNNSIFASNTFDHEGKYINSDLDNLSIPNLKKSNYIFLEQLGKMNYLINDNITLYKHIYENNNIIGDVFVLINTSKLISQQAFNLFEGANFYLSQSRANKYCSNIQHPILANYFLCTNEYVKVITNILLQNTSHFLLFMVVYLAVFMLTIFYFYIYLIQPFSKLLVHLSSALKGSFMPISYKDYPYIFSGLIKFYNQSYSSYTEYRRLERINSFNQARITLGRQVAHDIKSPLSTLNIVLNSINNIDDNKKTLIDKSLLRINEITKSLKKDRESVEATTCWPSLIIYDIVREKEIELDKFNIIFDLKIEMYYLLSKVPVSNFKRIVSNIINNAKEASANCVTINCEEVHGNIVISFIDNGKGIKAEHINYIFDQDFTFGKESGEGLGLAHAKNVLRSCKGSIKAVDSSLGATIQITLPKVTSTMEIKIKDLFNKDLHLIDDNKVFFKQYKNLFASYSGSFNVIDSNKNDLFLVDYFVMGEDRNGIDFIKNSTIFHRSILFSNSYNDELVLNQVLEEKIPFLPKPFAELIFADMQNKGYT